MTAAGGGGSRMMLYCVVPRALAARLHEPLRRHFRDDESIEVVVERRDRDRRVRAERRVGPTRKPAGEQRRVRSATGRRVADRRAPAIAVARPPLPRRLRRYADDLVFIERLEPTAEQERDHDSARLVIRFQSGEEEAFSDLYMRYYDSVYRYLIVALSDAHEAEDVAQQVFLRAFEALPDYEFRGVPLRVWLFTIGRNQVITHLRKRSRVELSDPRELDRRDDCDVIDDAELKALSWISDRELMMLIERLPPVQRQVLAMRYMLDLTTSHVAEVLDITPNHVSVLQRRALGFLRERLIALGREPERGGHRMRAWNPQAPVLRRRRFALFA